MTATLNTLDLESAAKEAAGNWREFGSDFCWHRKYDLESPNDWALIYTHNRDSGLLDQSNAEAIEEAMEPFTKGNNPDVVFETHNHWAVGHVDGFSIRVYRQGRITKAFRTWHGLQSRMAEYPLLDEDDYFHRCYEATIKNIADAAWRLKREFDLPKGWEARVYHWLADHDLSEIEDADDRGGYPSEEGLRKAFDALGYKRTEEEQL
jgi:hypothetical protein